MDEQLVSRIAYAADGIRLRVLDHTLNRRGGYLSQACSSADVLASLYMSILKLDELDQPLVPGPFSGVPSKEHPAVTGACFNGNGRRDCDNFILSPAQYALPLYATLVETGRLDNVAMENYNIDGSSVEQIGAEHSPGMEVTTGSLGQGISQAAGIAFARKRRGDTGRVVVFLSDGECQSGEFWEAVQAMSFHKLNNMLMFVDINGYQCDGIMTSVMNIEPFDDRIRAFGGRVFRIDGHNIPLILETYQKACEEPMDKPTFILCDTDVCHHMDILRERSKFHYVRFSSQEEWQRYRDYYNERMQERSEGWKF